MVEEKVYGEASPPLFIQINVMAGEGGDGEGSALLFSQVDRVECEPSLTE